MRDVQLSNVQLELLKLYSTDLNEKELVILKRLLAKFYAERATQTADKIWDQKKLSNQDIESWLNEG